MSNQTVLITGASSGIGFELAKLFSQKGYNLIVVSSQKDKLSAAAKNFKTETNSVAAIACDLSKDGSAQELYDKIKSQNMDVDILVNNAGFGLYGEFSQTDFVKEDEMMHVNMISLTHLTKLILKDMIPKGHGKILNVGSVGSFAPVPAMAVYAATKAYVLSFSEALAEELKGSVSITCLCPGATKTEFQGRSGVEKVKYANRKMASAEQVAKAGFDGLMANKRIVVPGFGNKLLVNSIRLIPRSTVTGMARSMLETKKE